MPIVCLLRSLQALGLLAFALTAGGAPAQDPAPAASSAAKMAKTFQDVTVEEFDRRRAATNVVVLDVRTPREHAAGHIPGAVNLDWNAPDFATRAARLDPAKTYLVFCATGRRSALACAQLTQRHGLTNCVNLLGGFSAWSRAGKPVAK